MILSNYTNDLGMGISEATISAPYLGSQLFLYSVTDYVSMEVRDQLLMAHGSLQSHCYNHI